MKTLSVPVPQKSSETVVWIAAAASGLLVLALLAAGQGTLIRLAIPLGLGLVGFVLYLHRPIGYLHFTLWTWFLTPLIRRLVDWHFGFQDHNLILVAPLLVSAISAITFLRERRFAPIAQLTPFYLCIAGISYGFAVGIIRWRLHASDVPSPGEIVFGLFDWIAPLFLGLHICIRWPMYQQQKEAIQQSFVWATLLLGTYGIYQFIVAPQWDRAWLEGLPLGFENSSFGHPAPFEIRVWSTLNGPGPFAFVMLTGVILLFGARMKYKTVFAAAGYISLLLSMVRTAWLAWILALFLLLARYRGNALRRLILGILLLPLCLLPMALSPEVSQTVQGRLASMQSIEQDGSFQDRKAMYEVVSKALLTNPAGMGLRNSIVVEGFVLDSGFLQVVAMLGLVGAILYGAGIMVAVRPRGKFADIGQHEHSLQVIFWVFIAELISGNMFISVGGMILWVFLGLWTAAHIKCAAGNHLPTSSDEFQHTLRSTMSDSEVA